MSDTEETPIVVEGEEVETKEVEAPKGALLAIFLGRAGRALTCGMRWQAR